MEKTIEFKIPEGYVFDKDNSTDEVIRFKPIKKKTTYRDVKQKLFIDCEEFFYFGASRSILKTSSLKFIESNAILSTSRQQLEQLLALNKLMNIAKYLNGDWKPDFTNSTEKKWCIDYDFEDSILDTDFVSIYRDSVVYFKSEELAFQAIEILGEEEVKKALGVFE